MGFYSGNYRGESGGEHEKNHEKPRDLTVLWALLRSIPEIANTQHDCYQIDDDIWSVGKYLRQVET